MHDYDDPYKMLAMHLISISTPAEIHRILTEDDYVHKMVIKELRGQDFCGPFLDAVICSILEGKSRMDMCRHLDLLADYFYSKLDLQRLRAEISHYLRMYFIIEV